MSEKRAPYDPGPPTPLSPEARRRLVIPEPDLAPEPDPLPDPEFSGCHKVRLKREDLEKREGRRIEYRDGDTETAYVMSEPVTDTHELPARGLSAACALIAEARGSPIRSYGSMDLVQPGAGGERRRIMQADEAVHLLPRRGLLPRGGGCGRGCTNIRTGTRWTPCAGARTWRTCGQGCAACGADGQPPARAPGSPRRPLPKCDDPADRPARP